MRNRCRNPKYPMYHRYGGRGIVVCERWNDFANFFADMGPRPSPSHTLERINNDGNYEPGNVRWATTAEQNRNTGQNVLLTFGGKTQTMIDWAIELGMKYSTLQSRIWKGWTVERALTTPVMTHSESGLCAWRK